MTWPTRDRSGPRDRDDRPSPSRRLPPLVQLPQVMSKNGGPGKAVPSGREPVRMSCLFGFISAVVDWLALFVERRLLGHVVLGRVQLFDVARDHHALGVVPRSRCRCGRARARLSGRSAPAPACSDKRAMCGRPHRQPSQATDSADPRRRAHPGLPPLPGPALVMKNVMSLGLGCGDCMVEQLTSVNAPAPNNNVFWIALYIGSPVDLFYDSYFS